MKLILLTKSIHRFAVILILVVILFLSTVNCVRTQGSGWNTTAINVTEFSFTPAAIDVTNAAQTITATLRVTDSERDFRFGNITFRSPVVGHQYGFGPEDRISGNARDGVYRKAFVFPQYSERGTWEVSSIFVYDGTADYYRWRDLSGGYLAASGFPTQFQVINNNEAVLPEISDFSFTPSAVDTTNHDRNVEITLRAKDDSGVGQMGVGFLNPPDCYIYDEENCAGIWFSIEDRHRVSGDDSDGVYRAVVQIPRQFLLGTYSASVYAFDGVNNRRRLNSGDLALSGYSSHLRNGRIARLDYGGDESSDISVWRPSNGNWFVRDVGTTPRAWGVTGDMLAPADYDGDGKTDIAVFRPSTGTWFIVNSSNGAFIDVQLGNRRGLARSG